MTSAYAMPSTSAASSSNSRWRDVQTVPRPRARAANMILQAAGAIIPHMALCMTAGWPSLRPERQGMTYTGISWKWPMKGWTDAMMRAYIALWVGLAKWRLGAAMGIVK